MSYNYDYWRKALAGEKPKMFVDDPQPGFYRKGVYEKQENKARKRVGWEPVAVFIGNSMTNGAMMAAVGVGGNREIILDRDRINELWSYIAGNPISEETYRAVGEAGEPWPDSHETGFRTAKFEYATDVALCPLCKKEHDLRDPCHETVPSIPVANSSATMVNIVPEMAPASVLAAQVDDAATQIDKYTKIESDEQSSKARSLQQKFLDLRSEAEKHYNELNRPLLDEQKRIRGIWFPIRDKADDAAKQLRDAMGRWEDTKRKAAQVAAERAEAGQEVRSNVPPPSTQIKGGTGRAASVTLQKYVTEIDVDKVFQQFRESPDVLKVLCELAQKAVRAGIAVPGATVIEKSEVR